MNSDQSPSHSGMSSESSKADSKYSQLEGDYSPECRIVVECFARPLKSARSRMINSDLILPKYKS